MPKMCYEQMQSKRSIITRPPINFGRIVILFQLRIAVFCCRARELRLDFFVGLHR